MSSTRGRSVDRVRGFSVPTSRCRVLVRAETRERGLMRRMAPSKPQSAAPLHSAVALASRFIFCLFFACMCLCFCPRALTPPDLYNRLQGKKHMCVCIHAPHFRSVCLFICRRVHSVFSANAVLSRRRLLSSTPRHIRQTLSAKRPLPDATHLQESVTVASLGTEPLSPS